MWKAWLSPGSSLSVGYRELDDGHRAVFRLFERVYSEAFTRSGEPTPSRTPELSVRIEELCGALEEHFRVEEALMDEYGYPDRLLHRAAHDGFREEIRFITLTLARGELTPALGGRIAGEAPSWIEAHIRTADRPLGRFLSARQGEGSGATVTHARRAARRSRVR
jgi:hemerythrin-like metal-binding protein